MDDKIFEAFQSIQKDIGKVLQGQDDLKSNIASVSMNGKETSKMLQAHVLDDEAHGIKTVNRRKGSIVAWAGLSFGALAAIREWLHR